MDNWIKPGSHSARLRLGLALLGRSYIGIFGRFVYSSIRAGAIEMARANDMQKLGKSSCMGLKQALCG
jgi:hypothetical protein